MTNFDQGLGIFLTNLPFNMIFFREDLNLECLCQMGLVMRDDGQGLDEYDVMPMMIMFDID